MKRTMKAKIRKTGEIVEIISYRGSSVRNEVLDSVSYIDSKGVEHDRESLNFYWDFERLEEKTDNTDWNQVRIQAAIVAMQGVLSNATMVSAMSEIAQRLNKDDSETLAMGCVGYANQLIEKLKKNQYD